MLQNSYVSISRDTAVLAIYPPGLTWPFREEFISGVFTTPVKYTSIKKKTRDRSQG
jgi:hypothetical protein